MMLKQPVSTKKFDWILLTLTLGLASLGLLIIYSATHGREAGDAGGFYIRQLWWLGIGSLIMFVTLSIDYRALGRFAYVFYALMVLSLIYVSLFGRTISGAQRWISVGPINLQPSEISKVILVMVLAKYFHDRWRQGPMGLKNLLLPAGLVLFPFALIVKQPDLGTALMLVLLSVSMAFLRGIKPRTLLFLMVLALVMIPLLWYLMEDYQRVRVLSFIYPNMDPTGVGYHSLQSKIAVGSGGLTGKGLMAGTQSGLNFLPEKHTDFIFAVVSEELGFLGSSVVIFLYLAIIIKGLSIAFTARDALGTLLAAGVVTMLALYVVLNIAMTVGMAPVVGIPLPLISYGGSSVVTTLLGIGLLMNVSMRRV